MSYVAFWADFIKYAVSLANELQSGNKRKTFDAIDGLLRSHSLDFCFDITTNETGCLVIFSPEGRFDDALSIDELLRAAPSLTAWTFLGRRPKKNLYDVAAIIRRLYILDPLQMRYRLQTEREGSVIEMIVPSTVDLSLEESKGMVNTFLWHAIGERRVMDQGIRGNVIFHDKPFEPTLSAEELMSLLE